MAQNIVGGLFGITPNDVYDTYAAQDRQAATALMNNPTLAQMGIYYGSQIGSGLGRGIASMLGAEDPRLQQANVMEEAKRQGFDVTTPEGLQQLASFFVQRGQPGLAQQVAQQAITQQQTMATTARTEQQAAREEQKFKLEDQLRTELSALPTDATDDQVLAIVRKYGDPTQIMKALEAKATKLAGEGVTGAAGPVGKAGAFRDVDGVIHGAAEMKTVNQEFKSNQELLKDLNDINYDDIKDAVSSFGIDYTTKGDIMKWFGGNKVQAQAKIAVAKLTQALENLPPGSASDADVRLALSTFPGYGSTDNLVKWLNETKKRLAGRIESTSTTYGFTPKVRSSGNLAIPQTTQESQGTWRLK